MSIILLVPETFYTSFNIIYIYCGISDMLDGYIARLTNSETKFGERLDSVSDIVFVIVVVIKTLPFLDLSKEIIIWVIFIFFIKIFNVIYSYVNYKRIEFPHTILNKLIGFILFITPFIIVNNNSIIIEIIICSVATLAAIDENIILNKIL